MEKIDKVFRCVCLRWSTSDESDYSETKAKENEVPAIWRWFSIEPFSSIAGGAALAREIHHIKQLIDSIPWAKCTFQVNKFATGWIPNWHLKALTLSYYYLTFSRSTFNLVIDPWRTSKQFLRTGRDFCWTKKEGLRLRTKYKAQSVRKRQ